MKKNFILFAYSLLLLMQSCSSALEENTTISIASVGGLLDVEANKNYIVGASNPETITLAFIQGDIKTTEIEIYKSFISSRGNQQSNEVLLKKITVENLTVGNLIEIPISYNYNDLIEGLIIGTTPLPATDTELNIGDYWLFKYKAITSAGDKVESSINTKTSVSTRFAGAYSVNSGAYYRVDILRDDIFFPEIVLVESVDASTYSIKEYFGPFEGNELFFKINSDLTISYPTNKPNGEEQSGNGEVLLTCATNPEIFTNVPCGQTLTNYVIEDEEKGKDLLFMTFGYFTSDSDTGPREFYQVLEKIN